MSGTDRPVTRRVLDELGWSLEPDIDVTAELAAFRAAGYEVPEEVVRFLATFTGLSLTSDGGNDLRIDPIVGLSMATRIRLQDYSDLAGTPLYPVGEADQHYLVVMCSSAWGLYGAIDWTLFTWGTGLDAIETFLTDGEAQYLRR